MREWIHQNFGEIVLMYEDRFDLRVLKLEPYPEAAEKLKESYNWWTRLTLRMTKPVLTSIVPGAGPLHSSAYFVRFYLPLKFQAIPPLPLPELDHINVENVEPNRRALRELLFTTPGALQYLSPTSVLYS